MRKLGGEVNLAQKALSADRLRDIRAKHLQCNMTVVSWVVREVDCRHAAAAELALNGVVVAKRALKLPPQIRRKASQLF